MSEGTTTGGGSGQNQEREVKAGGPSEIGGAAPGSTLASANGPHLTEEDGQRIADAMVELVRVSKGRIFSSVIPAGWTEDQGKRLTLCVNRVLEAGEAGLRTIEDVLHG